MIYLDVSSSCKSPVNTGVQRAVRGIHRSLKEAGALVTPLVWDPALRSYCRLSAREVGFLEAPFGGRRLADANPGKRANPAGILSKAARSVRRRFARVDLEAAFREGDALFVPEIFKDNRVAALPTLAPRVVAICHDAIALRRPDITPAVNAAGVAEYMTALGKMSAVIAVSEETRDELLAYWREAGQPATKVSVLGWPVDHSGGERPLTPPPSEGVPSILCVGTFEPRKNHLLLLDSAARLWNAGASFELVLVGRTIPIWGPKVEAAVQALVAAGRPVRWLRHVDDLTLDEEYARSAFTVFPSLAEGFGLPVMESLWHGRPCVCGSNGALGEVSAGGGCLHVDQTDPAALAAGIGRLLDDRRLLASLTEEARVRPFASWKDYAPAAMAVLDGA